MGPPEAIVTLMQFSYTLDCLMETPSVYDATYPSYKGYYVVDKIFLLHPFLRKQEHSSLFTNFIFYSILFQLGNFF